MSFLLVALIGSAAEVTDVFAFKAVNDLKNSQDWTASKSLNIQLLIKIIRVYKSELKILLQENLLLLPQNLLQM